MASVDHMRAFRWAAAASSALFVAGCDFGQVTSLSVSAPQCGPTNSTCFITRLDEMATFTVRGKGLCKVARLNFGDGKFLEENDHDFDKGPWIATRIYDGWPGLKTAMAEGVTNCTGKATMAMHVFKNASHGEIWNVGITGPFSDPINCFNAPLGSGGMMPPLRPNTTVTVSAQTTPLMQFGCVGGCAFDPNGRANTVAAAPEPFPGMRELSLVWRVGTQVVQGGTAAVTFVTQQPGPLEICVNDRRMSDNGGGWEVNILVDESQAP